MEDKRNSHKPLLVIIRLNIYFFLIITALLLIAPLSGVSEEGDLVEHISFSDEEFGDLSDKPKKLRINYTKYKSNLKYICNKLEKDGRREAFFNITSLLQVEDSNCKACRHFFRSFTSSCKPKRNRKPTSRLKASGDKEKSGKNGEASGKELERLPKRDPNVQLVDALSKLSVTLADSPIGHESYIAAQKLKAVLTRRYLGSQGATEYFDTFMAYFMAGFSEIKQAQVKKLEDENEFFKK